MNIGSADFKHKGVEGLLQRQVGRTTDYGQSAIINTPKGHLGGAMIEIFLSYAHEDEELMDEVRRQLIVFEREGQIVKWHDRQISPGSNWENEIDERLRRAKIILLFMSPSFIESKYCYNIEGREALRRHEAKEAVVIPVILRACAWTASPFGKLQALPHDGRPLKGALDKDEASLEVAHGVMAEVEKIIAQIE